MEVIDNVLITVNSLQINVSGGRCVREKEFLTHYLGLLYSTQLFLFYS